MRLLISGRVLVSLPPPKLGRFLDARQQDAERLAERLDAGTLQLRARSRNARIAVPV
jgi:hypothetical protein